LLHTLNMQDRPPVRLYLSPQESVLLSFGLLGAMVERIAAPVFWR